MTSPAPIYILDANLLLRLASRSHPHHNIARRAVRELRAKGAKLRTVPQAVFEFWVVATRDVALNGLGLNTTDAGLVLDALLQLFPLMADDPALVNYWRHLVSRHGIAGKPAHDARYVAAMQALRVTHLLTFDAGFSRYGSENIIAVDPSEFLTSRSKGVQSGT